MHELLQIPALHFFAFCAAILVLKMLGTGAAVGVLRMRRGAYVTPEDYAMMGKEPTPPDETVERLRRIHLNDLEQILPFLAIGFLYALSGPSPGIAWWLFAIFTVARLVHTGAYLASWQPWRSIFFEVGNVSLVVMTVSLLINLAA